MSRPYYEQDGITLFHGLAAEVLGDQECKERFEARNAVITDPPYGIGKDYGAGSVDDLESFRGAVSLLVGLSLPTALTIPVSRIFDLPTRPEWVGVWNKTWSASALIAYPFYPHWEAIAFYGLKGDYAGNRGHRSDVFTFAPIRADRGGHPTPKPLSLFMELVRFLSPHLVIDPFAGSGTTLLAAKSLNRKAIGIEVEERYCEIAARRLDQTVLDFGT